MLVVSTPSFNKDISKIKDKILASRIEQVILKLQLADNISEMGSLKTMSGADNAYRIRIGDYRLGFTVSDNTVRLVIFAHRKDIYRYFP
jgi:mRNA interferase RelE/StbE